MLKNIIFDIGGVLVDVRPVEAFMEKGYSREMAERMKKASWDDHEHWREFDRGVMKYSEVVDLFAQNDTEIANDIINAFSDVKGTVEMRSYTPLWINELKSKGLKVFYLSNWFEKLTLDCPKAIDFIPLMDGGIFSWNEKVVKPDYEIYNRLLSRYELKPQECAFVDDAPKNVQAALELGIHAIHFQSYEQVRTELEKYLS